MFKSISLCLDRIMSQRRKAQDGYNADVDDDSVTVGITQDNGQDKRERES